MIKLLRITTVPISLKHLIAGQMKYMKANGFEVIMMSAEGPEIEDVIKNESCSHEIIPLTRKITPFQDLKALWVLYKKIKEFKPDIVHSHTPKAGLIAMLASRIAGVPLRLHTIAGLPIMTMTGIKKEVLRFTEKLTAWGAHKILPNSKSMLQYIKSVNLISERKLDMIGEGSSNGIDLSRYNSGKLDQIKLQSYKSKFKNNTDTKIILAVGRLVKDKGINELVTTFIKMQASDENLHLILLGPLEKERVSENLEEITINALSESNNITHVNWSDEVEYFMAISDVLVHASHREGFPNVLLQAGAMNLPIVCSEIPGNIDIVISDDYGTTFPVKDESLLLLKIASTIQNYELALSKANLLKDYINKNYDRKIIHSYILQYYEQALANNR